MKWFRERIATAKSFHEEKVPFRAIERMPIERSVVQTGVGLRSTINAEESEHIRRMSSKYSYCSSSNAIIVFIKWCEWNLQLWIDVKSMMTMMCARIESAQFIERKLERTWTTSIGE